MSINWWMDKEIVVYIHNGILIGNENEWNLAFCSNVDGTGERYAKWNKSYRERQIPYVFTPIWILRNLTEDHGGGEEKKRLERAGAKHKRLWKTENNLRVDEGWKGTEGGWWVLRRAPFGMSTGCCMETNLTINFIYQKKKKNWCWASVENSLPSHQRESRWGAGGGLRTLSWDLEHGSIYLNLEAHQRGI